MDEIDGNIVIDVNEENAISGKTDNKEMMMK